MCSRWPHLQALVPILEKMFPHLSSFDICTSLNIQLIYDYKQSYPISHVCPIGWFSDGFPLNREPDAPNGMLFFSECQHPMPRLCGLWQDLTCKRMNEWVNNLLLDKRLCQSSFCGKKNDKYTRHNKVKREVPVCLLLKVNFKILFQTLKKIHADFIRIYIFTLRMQFFVLNFLNIFYWDLFVI